MLILENKANSPLAFSKLFDFFEREGDYKLQRDVELQVLREIPQVLGRSRKKGDATSNTTKHLIRLETSNRDANDTIIDFFHELVHAWQAELDGEYFSFNYTVANRHGYWNNTYETQARKLSRDFYVLWIRPHPRTVL